MPYFPTLKTGANAQYPLESTLRFSTQAVRFLDGSQQRFRLYGAGLRRWNVQLDQLDERELSALIGFVETQGSMPFSFTDPVTGAAVSNCAIAGGRFQAGMSREMCGQGVLTIEELA
jgi:hypothetical protein